MTGFMTVAEVAALLQVHPVTVRRQIQRGRLPAVRIGRRIRVPKAAVEQPRGGTGTKVSPLYASMGGMRTLTPEELATRRALYERVRANRDRQPPLGITTAELLREVRIEQGWPGGRGE